jgi:hypothetical protein
MLRETVDDESGRDAGYRRNVIGLERVLHAEQKAQTQDSQHPLPRLAIMRRPRRGPSLRAILDVSGICPRLGKIKNREAATSGLAKTTILD